MILIFSIIIHILNGIKHCQCIVNSLKQKLRNPCWKKATESKKLDYREELCRKLQDINISLSITNCHDVLCKNELYKSATDELMLDILLSIEKSANAHISKPKVNSSQHKPNIPNWKNEIEPFKDDAIFWHSMWLSAGKSLKKNSKRVSSSYKKKSVLHRIL